MLKLLQKLKNWGDTKITVVTTKHSYYVIRILVVLTIASLWAQLIINYCSR
jgi:hypothetical protein